MKKPLLNIFALVTRPEPQNTILCDAIHKAGGRAFSFPTVEIAPPVNITFFHQQIKKINQYDWLIFTSIPAITQSAPFIHATGSCPKKIAVLGQSSALAIKAAHLPSAIYPESDWRSEGLLALPSFQEINEKKIAIITGDAGRTFLKDTLQTRGANVTQIIAYRRILPPSSQLFFDPNINVSICTSNDIIKNLKNMINESMWQKLCQIPMIVASNRTALFAKEMGICKIFLAENPSLNAIISVLAKNKERICQPIRKSPKEIGEI